MSHFLLGNFLMSHFLLGKLLMTHFLLGNLLMSHFLGDALSKTTKHNLLVLLHEEVCINFNFIYLSSHL